MDPFQPCRRTQPLVEGAGPPLSSQPSSNCWSTDRWSHGPITPKGNTTNPMDMEGHQMMSDAEIAQQLNTLSVQEREKIYDEIHGVAEMEAVTPDFKAACLERLNRALRELPKTRRLALDRAIFLKPSIERDSEFRFMFLRAVDYDATKAAKRLAKFYDDKLRLFGDEKLVKKITLDDLSEDDMKVFRNAFFVVLPIKDSSGRPIWFCDLSRYDFTIPDSLIRCSWYQVMATLEDKVAHSKGVVNICYIPGRQNFFETISNFSEVLIKGGDTLNNLPIRCTSHHFCYNSIVVEHLRHAMTTAFGRQVALRLRAHHGSDIEVQYSLMTFGISCSFLGCKDGSALVELHKDYLERRRIQDRVAAAKQEEMDVEFRKSTNMISYPKPKDILVGRGCPYQNWSGNLMLARLIDTTYVDRYMKTNDRFEKTCIHMNVVRTVQESFGGRFLERTKDGWKIVQDQIARKKVSSAFRTRTAKVEITATAGPFSATKDSFGLSPHARGLHIMPPPEQPSKRLRYDPSILS